MIQEMMRSKLMVGSSAKLTAVISDIEERHNDLLKLEKVRPF